MQYYFSLVLSFVPNVGDKSLTETTFTFEASRLIFPVHAMKFFFLAQPPLDRYFKDISESMK